MSDDLAYFFLIYLISADRIDTNTSLAVGVQSFCRSAIICVEAICWGSVEHMVAGASKTRQGFLLWKYIYAKLSKHVLRRLGVEESIRFVWLTVTQD